MPGILPDEITAGVTLDHAVTLIAYPAPEWGLKLIMRGHHPIDLIATPDDTQHRLAASAAVTATWEPGVYWFSLRATRGAEVVEVDEGQIRVRANLAAINNNYDGRSHVERVLASIEAVIEGRATKDQERYTINNRELWRTPIADLLLLRTKYRDELRRLQAAARGQSLLGRQVKVRF